MNIIIIMDGCYSINTRTATEEIPAHGIVIVIDIQFYTTSQTHFDIDIIIIEPHQ